jgi:electron transport complex protein RnfG
MAGAGAGLLLVFVFQATQPTIQAYKAEVLKRAVSEVLAAPARFETLYLHSGKLTPHPPDDVDAAALDRVFLGYDREGQRIGFALVAAEPGFQDVVKVIFGYDPRRRRLLGMRVLESKETPGLGDKIEKDLDFVSQFERAEAPLTGVKSGSASSAGEIDMITGATISSRAVIRIINHSITRWGPFLDAYPEVRQ